MNCKRKHQKLFLVSALVLPFLTSIFFFQDNAGAKEIKNSMPVSKSKAVRAAVNYDSPDCKGYLNGLTGKLNNKWYIPDGKNKVVISCKLESDGSTQDVTTTSTPSSAEAEQAANTAFVQAQPFGALPSSAGTKVKLTLEFISSADPHGDSSRHINAVLSDPNK